MLPKYNNWILFCIIAAICINTVFAAGSIFSDEKTVAARVNEVYRRSKSNANLVDAAVTVKSSKVVDETCPGIQATQVFVTAGSGCVRKLAPSDSDTKYLSVHKDNDPGKFRKVFSIHHVGKKDRVILHLEEALPIEGTDADASTSSQVDATTT